MSRLSRIRAQVAAKEVSKSPTAPFQTLKGLFILYKPFLHLVILSHLLNTANLLIQLVKPHYWGGVIDIVTRSKDAQEFKETVFNMLVYYIISNIVSRIHSKVKSKVSRSLNAKFKERIYNIILEKDMEFFDKTPQPEVINVLGTGSSSLQSLLLSELTGPFECIFNLCGTLLLIYSISPQLTIFLLMLIPPKAFLTYYSHKADTQLMTRHMTLSNQMHTIPFSLVQNMLLIKLFSTEKKELQDVCEKKDELSEIEEITDQKSWKMSFIRGLVDQLLQLALIWYGGLMVFEGTLTAGDLSKFSLYCGSMINSTSTIQNKVRRLLQSLMQSEKLLDILNYESKVKLVNPNAVKKETLKGAINIKDLSFCYPSKPNVEVLQNINVNIKEGESVAFVGQNGSGKTTINYLLQRLYDPIKGEITIDETNIKDYDVTWLHKHIGYVSQEPVLLDKTVEENIAYGLDSYTSEQIDKAIKISNSEYILDKDRFPDGLKTLIGANGVKLSGGEKQRIAIARALVREPKILILDEPTSALDGESEVQVQQAINNMMKKGNMTVIVVAHKVSSIENCDKIYVYNQGKIVEEGNHKSLVEADGAYTKLFKYQISQKKIVGESEEASKGA